MINRPSAAIPAPRGSGCYEFVSDHRLRIPAILLRGAPEASLCSRRLSWEQPARLHSPKRSPPSEAERETVDTRRMDPEAAGWDTEVFSERRRLNWRSWPIGWSSPRGVSGRCSSGFSLKISKEAACYRTRWRRYSTTGWERTGEIQRKRPSFLGGSAFPSMGPSHVSPPGHHSDFP